MIGALRVVLDEVTGLEYLLQWYPPSTQRTPDVSRLMVGVEAGCRDHSQDLVAESVPKVRMVLHLLSIDSPAGKLAHSLRVRSLGRNLQRPLQAKPTRGLESVDFHRYCCVGSLEL